MPGRVEEPHPAPPRIRQLKLGVLHPINPDQFLDDDAELEGVELEGLVVDELVWTGRRRLDASSATGLMVGDWTARGCGFTESVLERTQVRTLSARGSGWRAMQVRNSRLGFAELCDSELRAVHFENCKIGYLNLRDAHLSDVCFVDCILEDVDLIRASALRIAFPGSRITRLDVTSAKLKDFDLRGAQLSGLEGLAGLRGATISADQLLSLIHI